MRTFCKLPTTRVLIPILLWLLPTLAAATNCAIQTAIPQTQCNALLDLYNGTGGSSWTNSPTNGWNQNDLPCTWMGVTCGTGGVTQIILTGNNLSGSLPNTLSNLSGLTTLALSENKLTGTIPTLPASLTQLNLFTNQLTGSVPALPSGLTDLDLTFNQLSGSLPTLPTGLTKLWISSNQLSGTIPTLPSSLTSLRLSNNAFTGVLPSFSSLTGLTMLELGFNAITSAAPGEDTLVTAKQADWKTTQTLPPQSLNTSVLSDTSIQVNWTVLANAGTGNFQVKYATTMGGPYTNAATTTPDQTATNYIVTGLSPNTTYYFVVQTITQPSLPQQQNTLSSELSQEVAATTAPCVTCPVPSYQSIPAIEVSLDFGTPFINTPSQATLTVQEVGNAPLNISGLQITGADAARFQILPPTTPAFSIADGGADQVITVQCLPTTTAPLNATLQLLTNDSNYPTVAYPLLCTGVLNNFSLSIATTGQGTITGCGASCTQTHLQNSAITLVAMPTVGWQLGSWSGDCVNGQVVMTANKTCTANFIALPPPNFSLTLNTTGQGSINGCGASCTQTQPQNTTISLAVTPTPGWQLGSWSGDCVNGQVVMTANKTCTANFTALPPPVDTPVTAPAAPPAPPSNGTANGVMSNYNQSTTNLVVTPNASVSGGTFAGTTTNSGLIANANIAPNSTLTGGKLSGFNTNNGIITDVTVSQYSQISGGSYGGTINNQGLLIYPNVLPNAQIIGGKLEGAVLNQGVLQDVTFAPNAQVLGGTLTGKITGNPDHYVIIGEADVRAVELSNACLTVTATPPATAALNATVITHQPSSSGALATQDFCIAPQTIAGFTPQQISVTEKLAFSSFTAQNISELPLAALSALIPQQLANVPLASLQGLSIEQYQAIPVTTFGGLQQNNMGGLNTQVIYEVDQAHLAALSATEFQQMPGIGVSKWLTNVNTDKVSLAEIQPLLPTGWQVAATGEITAPADTHLALKALEAPQNQPSDLTLPNYQFDLNTHVTQKKFSLTKNQ